MEFENYERELKYLIKKNEKYTSKQFLEFLYENDYEVIGKFISEAESKKVKLIKIAEDNKIINEAFNELSSAINNDFSILKRGDVMRGSNMVTEQFKGFLYKTNKCNPQKPYVSKLELGTKLRGQYKDVNEFIKELNIDVKGQLNIKLFANMKREVSIVEKDGDRLYVSYDKVKYFEKDESNSVYEEMLEIEDWKNPNTTNVDYDYDRHLIKVNNLISNAQLPIELTKDSKYFRGYTVLNNR